ncbi:MAG: hypothetical protein FJ267_03005 [Planctomycetes bacterium]|nr:hypothetical protein [Planctomycetota bacterium]
MSVFRSCFPLILVLSMAIPLSARDPIQIGSRRELFVDLDLFESPPDRVDLRIHHPTPREIAVAFDQPWEGNASGYPTVIQDGSVYRMYYRGHRYIIDPPPLRQAQPEVVCYAESQDGIVWKKPQLGLYDWPPTQNGSGNKNNNIIWRDGHETHNFAPFLDTNPDCKPDARYKAIGGTITSKGLLTFKSADGIHWSKLSAGPVVTKGAFDSHNTCFWDSARRSYVMYVRYFSEEGFRGLRSIGVSYSTDFTNWTEPVGLNYPDSPPQQMYTNQIAPYYRAPHQLFGFPTRFVSRPQSAHATQLEPVDTRAKFAASIKDSGAYTGAEVTDGLFMTSRDGRNFHRWNETFLTPGPQEEGRWIYGDNYQSYGLFETKAANPARPNEISFHFNEGAWRDEMHRVRRYSIRLDGFVSLYGPLSGTQLTSKPVVFSGKRLSLNYATSALGNVKVELRDERGNPIPGFSLNKADELYGDSTDQTVTWNSNSDVSQLAGHPIRIHFSLHDAHLYSFRFID